MFPKASLGAGLGDSRGFSFCKGSLKKLACYQVTALLITWITKPGQSLPAIVLSSSLMDALGGVATVTPEHDAGNFETCFQDCKLIVCLIVYHSIHYNILWHIIVYYTILQHMRVHYDLSP